MSPPQRESEDAAPAEGNSSHSGTDERSISVPLGWSTLPGLIAAGIAALSFVWGVAEFISDRRLEREVRILGQSKADLARIVELPAIRRSAVSEARLLLGDLEGLSAIRSEIKPLVTSVLVSMAMYDYDYEDREDADLAAFFLQAWRPLRADFGRNSGRNEFVVYRILQALRTLAEQDPGYFATISADDSGRFQVRRFTIEERYLHFQGLYRAFVVHTSLFDPTSEQESTALKGFADALDNRGLTAVLRRQIETERRHETAPGDG